MGDNQTRKEYSVGFDISGKITFFAKGIQDKYKLVHYNRELMNYRDKRHLIKYVHLSRFYLQHSKKAEQCSVFIKKRSAALTTPLSDPIKK